MGVSRVSTRLRLVGRKVVDIKLRDLCGTEMLEIHFESPDPEFGTSHIFFPAAQFFKTGVPGIFVNAPAFLPGAVRGATSVGSSRRNETRKKMPASVRAKLAARRDKGGE